MLLFSGLIIFKIIFTSLLICFRYETEWTFYYRFRRPSKLQRIIELVQNVQQGVLACCAVTNGKACETLKHDQKALCYNEQSYLTL